MAHLLHTERLRLRPCRVDDLDSLHELWTETDVRRFLFDDRAISCEEARSFVAASKASFADDGYGLWLFFEDQSNLIAGFVGLLHSNEGPPSLIFGTRPQLWGTRLRRGSSTRGASLRMRRTRLEARGRRR